MRPTRPSLLPWICLLSAAPAQLQWRRPDLFEGRYGAVAAFDAVRQRLVVFGGHVQDSPTGETWEWDGAAWMRRTPAHAPSARSGHAMVFDPVRRHVLLFGGQGATRLADTWAWDGHDWTLLQPAHAPAARSGHDLAWDSLRACGVLFGGSSASSYLDDTWEWNGGDWVERMPAHRPPRRTAGAMTFATHRGRTFLFGGICPFGGPCVYRDAWEWDGVDWVQVPGEFPSWGRWGHRVVYDQARQRVVLFGGSDEPLHYYDDTWEWDGATWHQVVPVRNVPAREMYAMAYDTRLQSVVLTSGIGWFGAVFSDTWRFLGDRWSRVHDGAPTGRMYPAMAFDSARGCTVMFGGFLPESQTWEWDGTAWRNPEPAVTPPPTAYSQMAFDPVRRVSWLVAERPGFELWGWDGNAWRRAVTATSPPAGDGHAVAWDDGRSELVLLTAGGGARASETWTFAGTDWQRRQPAHVPPPRARAAIAYDDARARVVVFGGDDAFYTLLRDTWEWDGQDWQQRLSAHTPPALREPRLVYDAARRRTVLLGSAAATETTLWEWDGSDWLLRDTNGGVRLDGPGGVYDLGRREVLAFSGQTAQIWRLGPAQPADYFSFGSGCRGSNGAPRLTPALGDLPWLGETFTLELDNLPPSPFLILFFGVSRTHWGPVALPVGLDYLGMSGCSLWVSGDLVIPLTTASGRSSWVAHLPADPWLAGAAFYHQSWQVDWRANPGLATTSNACEGRLGIK